MSKGLRRKWVMIGGGYCTICRARYARKAMMADCIWIAGKWVPVRRNGPPRVRCVNCWSKAFAVRYQGQSWADN